MNLSNNNHYYHNNLKEDLIKEFNLNYKNYLENLLIYQIINEIVNEKKIKLNNCNENILNRFWKSFLLTNININDYLNKLNTDNETSSILSSSSSTSTSFVSQSLVNSSTNSQATTTTTTISQADFLSNQLKLEDFDDLKNEFINEIEKNLNENYLNKIENLIKFDLKDEDNDLNDRCFKISNKIKQITFTNEINSKQILKLNDDLNMKLKNYLNLTHEIVNLLIKLINEFKLGFYLRKDLVSLESILFKCDMFLTKIETVLGECLIDTYTNDKLKCFNIIKENINLNLKKSKEKYETIKNAYKLYKSLGSEYEIIHKSYIELKSTLDNRQWTLNKLKNEIFY